MKQLLQKWISLLLVVMLAVAGFVSVPLAHKGQGATSYAATKDDSITSGSFIEPMVSQTTVPPGYTGIYKAQDLSNVRNNLSGKFILMNDIDLSGWGNWTPIGDNSTDSNTSRFTGTFDGNGYVIKNMIVHIESNSSGYVGLFGYVSGGEIKNVGLVGGSVRTTVSYMTTPSHSGGIAGKIIDSSITNCYNTGVVNATSVYLSYGTYTACYVGGIVGCTNNSSDSSSMIVGCYSTGDVCASAITSSCAGGIVGYANKSSGSSSVTDCYNTGTVRATSSDRSSGAGGIVGVIDSSSGSYFVDDCYNSGSVSTSSAASYRADVGGIIGYAYDSACFVTDCYYFTGCATQGVGSNSGSVTNVIALSATQMRTQSSFVGFDFATVWGIDPNINSGYPYLRNVGVGNSTDPTDPISITSIIFSQDAYIAPPNDWVYISADYASSALEPNATTLTWSASPASGVEFGQMSVTGTKNNAIISIPIRCSKLGTYTITVTTTDGERFEVPLKITDDPSAVFGKFSYVGGKTLNENHQALFHYSDTYFSNNAYTYRPDLATMSQCLAMSTFGVAGVGYPQKADNVKALLEKIGCNSINVSETYLKEPETNSIGVAFGLKQLRLTAGSNDDMLLVIAVRGGGYEAEWGGNFQIGKGLTHEGFDLARKSVLNYLNSYIEQNKDTIAGKNLKVWITGYSRGSAVANLVAADFDKGIAIKSEHRIQVSPHNVYAYCFETPAVSRESDVSNSLYFNINCWVNHNDFVPKLPPADWGYHRYGMTRTFPSAITTADYASHKNQMLGKWSGLSGFTKEDYVVDDFYAKSWVPTPIPNTTQGIYLDMAIADIAVILHSPESYVDRGDQNRLIDFGRKTLGKGEDDWANLINEVFSLPILGTLKALDYYSILKKDSVPQGHYPELCLAWLQSYDSNYDAQAASIGLFGVFRTLRVNCPVDVKVYDSKNKLVASIISDVPQGIIGSTIISSVDENDQKIVYLPADGKYTAKLTARDDCKMTYSVGEFDCAEGITTRVVNYFATDMKKGESTTGLVEDLTVDSAPAYELLNGENEIIQPSENLTGDKVERYSVSAQAQGDGTVSSNGSFVRGEFAKVVATPNNNREFLGWYKGDTKVSSEAAYRFCVLSDVSLTARFSTESRDSDTQTDTDKLTDTDTQTPAPVYESIATAQVVTVADQAYTGKQIKPTLTVKVGGTALKAGTDYTLAYGANKNIGKSTITLTGKGAYTGTKVVSFKIVPTKTSISKLTVGKKQIKVAWKPTPKAQKITKYQLRYRVKGTSKWTTKAVSAKNASLTIKKLKKGKQYQLQVRSYKTVSGIKYYSPWSASKTSKKVK